MPLRRLLIACLFATVPGLVAALHPGLARGQDMALSGVLIDNEGWQLVSQGHKFTEGPTADAAGNVYFSDIPESRIHRISPAGEVSLFASDTGKTNGLKVGPDGRLFGCRGGDRQIVAYRPDGQFDILARDVDCNDLALDDQGAIWFTDPPGGRVWHLPGGGDKKIVAEGLKPNGIGLWEGGGTLVVTDAQLPVLWTFRVAADGTLGSKERYYGPLQIPFGADRPGSDGLTLDRQGRLYVATFAGVQMFDPTGRLGGTIARPQPGPLSNVCLGGARFDHLYVTAGDKVFRRRVQATGRSLQKAP